jgi:hypothetical protein
MPVDKRPRFGRGSGECGTAARDAGDARQQRDEERRAPVMRRHMQRTGINREAAGNRDDDKNDERRAPHRGGQRRRY